MFKVKNLKKIRKILNIRIICDQEVKTLQLNQSYYINEILDRLQMLINKSNLVKLSINKYDSFRFAKLKNKQIN